MIFCVPKISCLQYFSLNLRWKYCLFYQVTNLFKINYKLSNIVLNQVPIKCVTKQKHNELKRNEIYRIETKSIEKSGKIKSKEKRTETKLKQNEIKKNTENDEINF